MPKITAIRPFLLKLPERLQIVIIIGATVAAAFAAALGARALFDLRQLLADSELTFAVYGVLGTVYAILLAFVVSGIWQNFSKALATVHAEADALMGLIHISEAFPLKNNQEVCSVVLSYAQMAIDEEWDTLARVARGSVAPDDLLGDPAMALMRTVQSLEPLNPREVAVFEQALVMLNNWLDARRERLQSAMGGNAQALWPLLIAGALVLFAFHGLFAAKSTLIWAALLFCPALVVGLSFYLIFSLDSPFTGSLAAHADPFRWVVRWCQRHNPAPPEEPAA